MPCFSMPAALALALALSLASLAPGADGVAVPLGSQGTPDTNTLRASCVGQGNRSVCYPLPTGGRDYVQCGPNPVARRCASGTRFDYVQRRCVRASFARPCPTWNCPAGFGPALSRPYGTFGEIGNFTIPLYKKESFTIVCPVHGHCLGGMNFNVHVECPAPPDRTPFTFEIDFEETLNNSMLYPKRMADIWAFCGDHLFLEWDEPIHLVQLFNTSADARPLWQGTLVNPFPPQPVYQCPTWPMMPDEFPIPLPGDEVILNVVVGAQNATWTANMTETFFFVCPLFNHCRLGQVFKVTVTERPAGAAGPTQYNIMWSLNSDNFEDMHLYVGDSIMFNVPGNPPQAHGLYKVAADRIRAL